MYIPEVYDVTIYGGGPTGLFVATLAGQAALSSKIIEPTGQLGGQLSQLYPDKRIINVPGFHAIKARTLAARLIKQARVNAEPAVYFNSRLVSVQSIAAPPAPPLTEGPNTARADTVLQVTSTSGEHKANAVILTTAGQHTPRRLDISYNSALDGKKIFYSVPDRSGFKGKRVLVVGGGKAALEWSLELIRTAACITLANRNSHFDAYPSLAEVICIGVDVRTSSELKAIAETGKALCCTLKHADGVTAELEVDRILVCIGSVPDLSLPRQLGLAVTEYGIQVGPNMETNIPGIYAIGDAADYPHKQRLIVSGFAEAAAAVNHINQVFARSMHQR